LSYRAAGVDIDAGDLMIRRIGPAVARTHGERVLRGLGHFGGFFQVGPAGPNATLVASIDGVGTKLMVAQLAGNHAGIGADIVHHCVNDILACGATPLFFLDYFATGRLDAVVGAQIVSGIARACEAQGIALLGGETAEMPGLYTGDDYDLAGVIVGMVDAERIVDGARIMPGDVILGLPSSGFHTNGYSLIRAALGLNRDDEKARERLRLALPFDPTCSVEEALLTPHRCYLPELRELLEGEALRGMAHITGGGIPGNLGRVIPGGLTARIDVTSWTPPPLFYWVLELGHISEDEAFRVFNMGIGFVLVCSRENVAEVLQAAPEALVIGEVTADNGARVTLERRSGQA
jgi:phosphoribosylformylglycinamidine cyclo-ligase